jgi:predicted secreted protein
MKKLYTFFATAFFVSTVNSVQASNLVRVKALGSSPRGQYVAFEEFGYKNGRKLPFSKIRIMNVWKNKYADKPVQVVGNTDGVNLNHVRIKAKSLAQKQLEKFNIVI